MVACVSGDLLLLPVAGDWTRNIHKEEYPAIQRIYEVFGKADCESELLTIGGFSISFGDPNEKSHPMVNGLSGACMQAACMQEPDRMPGAQPEE